MDLSGETLGQPELFFALGLGLFVLSLILFIIVLVRLGRMNKRYKAMLNGKSGADYEELLIDVQERVKTWGRATEANEMALRELKETLKLHKTKVEMIRYHAFDQHGSDLSFSMAILNDYRDGVVLTGIHSREQTFMYAKPLNKGESTYALSPEEKQVIELAAGGASK
ncbi:DUF4446 family protein [Gorillibacterium timonense]|uniref:DUF4446 family protein n=1 Tax=Gorillibacterium timonense TaxID=1689269 RepID=UPI00071D9BBB|nr:DUF4446 family protein [Gorillibacterium timonense]